MRLGHLVAQCQNDVAMRLLDLKLVQRGFALPRGQAPKLPRADTRPQGLAEQARCRP